jgi:hypothetical protein
MLAEKAPAFACMLAHICYVAPEMPCASLTFVALVRAHARCVPRSLARLHLHRLSRSLQNKTGTTKTMVASCLAARTGTHECFRMLVAQSGSMTHSQHKHAKRKNGPGMRCCNFARPSRGARAANTQRPLHISMPNTCTQTLWLRAIQTSAAPGRLVSLHPETHATNASGQARRWRQPTRLSR